MARLTIAALAMLLCGGLSAQFDDTYLGGTTQPAAGTINQSTTDNHALAFGLLRPLSSLNDTLTRVDVQNTASAPAAGAGEFSQLRLWLDSNANGTFEPGTDSVLSTVSSTSFPVSFTGLSVTIPAGNGVELFVSIDVSATATAGNKFLLFVDTTDVYVGFPVSSATPAQGNQQTVGSSAANQIAVTQDPAGATPATAFSTQPVVELRNGSGALLSGDNSTMVTVSIASGSGTSGAVLGPSGSLTVQASGGVVTYSGLMLDLAGVGYVLTFSATGFTSANSASFNVGTSQAATKLVIAVQPGGAVPATPFGTQPVVEIQDAGNQLVTGATHFVAVSLNGGSGGTLSGTLIVQAVNGVATFTDLSINQAGSGYSLTFSAVNLTSDTSAAFDVSSGGSSSGGGGGGGGGGGCVAAGRGTSWLWLLALCAGLTPYALLRKRGYRLED